MLLCISRRAKAAAVICLGLAPALTLGAPASANPADQHEWWLRSLHVTEAWRSGEGSHVTVALLADGVAVRQPDVAGSVTSGPDFTGSGRKAGDPYFGVVGTGLASLIAGHGHGKSGADGLGLGVYGVAGQASIMSLRVTLSPGDPLWSNTAITSRLPDAIAAGIRYAVNHDASVIELPPDPGVPGLTGYGDVPAAAGGSTAERLAVGYAERHDVLVVAPAGDDAEAGDAADYPAAYPGVVAVGAFGPGFIKSPFSSRQPYVTLTAAGQEIVAAAPSGYQTMNSTWAASAIVAGIAALIRSRFPSLTAAQVRTALTSSTAFRHAGGKQDGSGYGTVDALGASNRAARMSPPHAQPAVRGALPRRRPVVPAVASRNAVITADLTRDGEIAAGALLVLLIPITMYGAAGRRRDRSAATASADRAASQARAEPAGMLADPLLEFFGPQHARPDDRAGNARQAGQRMPASPRYQPRPSLTGRSTLSGRPQLLADVPAPPAAPPAVAAPAMMPAPTSVDPAAETSPAPGSDDGSDAVFRWASRAGEASSTVARAHVTGRPPWEPAPQPTTALPWATPVPAPGSGSGTAPRTVFTPQTRQAPPSALWGDSGSVAPAGMPGPAAPPGMPGPTAPGSLPGSTAGPGSWPGSTAAPPGMPGSAAPGSLPGSAAAPLGFPAEPADVARPAQPGYPGPGYSGLDLPEGGRTDQGWPDPAAADDPGYSDSGSRPIYVWNPPGTATDRFPAVDAPPADEGG